MAWLLEMAGAIATMTDTLDTRQFQLEQEMQETQKTVSDIPAQVREVVANLVIELVTRIEVLEDHKRRHDFVCEKVARV